jgi:HEAT repeat protein
MGDEKGIEYLIQLLDNKNDYTRKMALRTIGKILDKRFEEPLIQALNDENKDVRKEAAIAFRNMGSFKAVIPLTNIGDVRAIEALIQALKDEDIVVQVKAELALEEIGKPAIKPLEKFLNAKKHDFRAAVKRVLDKIKVRKSKTT